jgi:hypothetical protein
MSRHEAVDGDHGRIETRVGTVIHDIAWLQERHKWPALTTVIIIESTREIGSKTERETRFYISSLNLPADKLGPILRSRWAVITACIESWIWSSAMTKAAPEPTTPRLISPASNTSQPIFCDCPTPRTRFDHDANRGMGR